jgi:hypothetical protein
VAGEAGQQVVKMFIAQSIMNEHNGGKHGVILIVAPIMLIIWGAGGQPFFLGQHGQPEKAAEIDIIEYLEEMLAVFDEPGRIGS